MEKIYKILLKKIKDELNKWRYMPCSWIEKCITVKMAFLPN